MVFPKNIKLIIFDFDGTLHTLPIDWQKMREVAGIVSTNESLGDAIERFKKENQLEILDKITQVEQESLANEQLDPTIKKTIQKLQERFSIAILSRNSRLVIETFLKANGIEAIYTIGREDTSRLKPHPEGLQLILDKFQVKPNEAVLVGDTYHDIELADDNGLFSILVGDSVDLSNKFRAQKVNNLSEIIETIDNIKIRRGDG